VHELRAILRQTVREFLAQVLEGSDCLPEIVGIGTQRSQGVLLSGDGLKLCGDFAVDLIEPLAVTLAIEVEPFSAFALLVGTLLVLIERSAPWRIICPPLDGNTKVAAEFSNLLLGSAALCSGLLDLDDDQRR
jgi:hypothetical protein